MIRREARAWLIRLQSRRDPDSERKFRSWYDSDRRHAEAFESVRRNFESAGLLRQSSASHNRELQPPRTATIVQRPRFAWAAVAAIALLVPAGWLLFERGAVTGTNAMMLVTSVGEIRHIDLADGSKVTLDTDTKVEVDVGRTHRRVRLAQGRARFEIAEGKAPFVVEAGRTTVTSEAARFDIARTGGQSWVDVLSGSVDVRDSSRDPADSFMVRGGQSVAAAPAGLERSGAIAGGTEWTRGMLEFDATPLESAVELANRYSERKILISGDVGELRVTGAFRAGDVMGLAKALAAAFHLSLAAEPDGNLLLSEKADRNDPKKKGGKTADVRLSR
jgi:transmembrane sensor